MAKGKAHKQYELGNKVGLIVTGKKGKKIIDLDLEKYFDTVNHDLLLKMLRETIQEEGVIKLIKKYLKSGVMSEGLVSQRVEGTPQGGNLSPLLSNIYLTKFDRLLEERGHKFVRYADDCNIYVKSARSAERVMESRIKYLEGTLKLKVNRKKSKTDTANKTKFLGFSLYQIAGRVGIRVHEKTQERLKERLKAMTGRSRRGSIASIFGELTKVLQGWMQYYRIADMKKYLTNLSEWLRRRIWQLHWKR